MLREGTISLTGDSRARRWPGVLVGSLLIGCASAPPAAARDVADANDTGSTLVAKSQSERALLTDLPGLPALATRRLGDATVMAEAPYAAASGRTCRALHVTSKQPATTRHRLACSDGKSWFFVPDVFGDGRAGQAE